MRPAARDEDDHHTEAAGGLHETEEEKNYWNSILNLVNSSAAATSARGGARCRGVLAGAGVLTTGGEPWTRDMCACICMHAAWRVTHSK
ncbi:hypothetical protein PR202_gb15395 [Eleusine coracana subsp. coracana]|uniref:Uncharacterized protein n=1 Tax=Eleusine coracana subsp. coracana TaxID=191504 RepID=A0AAV5EYZ8_ELECO|nr:hypothetical protein PR202_gb15395 [Eleusine coracana subsp. coracana]